VPTVSHPAPTAGPDARRRHEGPEHSSAKQAAASRRCVAATVSGRAWTPARYRTCCHTSTVGDRTTLTAPHRRPPGAHPPTSRQKLTRANHIPERGSDADVARYTWPGNLRQLDDAHSGQHSATDRSVKFSPKIFPAIAARSRRGHSARSNQSSEMRSSWHCVRPAATVCRPQQPSVSPVHRCTAN
jgi:hypothetical protein